MAVITMPPPDSELVERKRKLALARGTYFVWLLALGFGLMVIPLPMTAEALRNLLPSLGAKLSKVAVVGTLFSGQSMAKVDSAWIAAGVIYIVVIYFWRELLSLWLDPDAAIDFHEGPYKAVVTLCGVLVLIVDCILMYVAVAALNWGTLTFSFVALLFTITYMVCLIFASLVSMRLKKKIRKLEEEL